MDEEFFYQSPSLLARRPPGLRNSLELVFIVPVRLIQEVIEARSASEGC